MLMWLIADGAQRIAVNKYLHFRFVGNLCVIFIASSGLGGVSLLAWRGITRSRVQFPGSGSIRINRWLSAGRVTDYRFID